MNRPNAIYTIRADEVVLKLKNVKHGWWELTAGGAHIGYYETAEEAVESVSHMSGDSIHPDLDPAFRCPTDLKSWRRI